MISTQDKNNPYFYHYNSMAPFIAKMMRLSPTTPEKIAQRIHKAIYIVKSTKADFGARYFTPAEEIPLAGHPTIAVIRALIEMKKIVVDKPFSKVTLELKAGIIDIDIEIFREAEDDYKIVMAQLKPQFLSIHDPKKITDIFNLETTDLLPDVPIQTVSTGTPQLMIPLKSLDALKKVSMDTALYKRYRENSDFFSPHFFCLKGITEKGSTFARHLGEPPDTAEDAFTGSATGGMGAYLWHHRLLKTPSFIAEQGHWMGRPGSASVEIVGNPNHIQTVKVGGKAVIVAKGEIDI